MSFWCELWESIRKRLKSNILEECCSQAKTGVKDIFLLEKNDIYFIYCVHFQKSTEIIDFMNIVFYHHRSKQPRHFIGEKTLKGKPVANF